MFLRMTTTLTSREFNQDTARAKRASKKGPVFITDRGEPSHVLVTIEVWRKLTGRQPKMSELLGMKGLTADLEIPEFDDLPEAASFS